MIMPMNLSIRTIINVLQYTTQSIVFSDYCIPTLIIYFKSIYITFIWSDNSDNYCGMSSRRLHSLWFHIQAPFSIGETTSSLTRFSIVFLYIGPIYYRVTLWIQTDTKVTRASNNTRKYNSKWVWYQKNV